MDLPALLPVSSSRPASNADPVLRPFQRVTAQVLSVTGTNALLSIEGHPVVARLTSGEQAATLLSQRSAQFIITSLTGQEITLKLVHADQPDPGKGSLPRSGPELAVRLLAQNNIPLNGENLMLARSVLGQGLPLTSGLLTELLGALSESGAWGQAEAELAAALKGAGLPVTAQSLALAVRQAAQTGEALEQLIAQLQSAGQNLPPELLKEIRRNLRMLEGLVLSTGGDTARLAAQLEKAIHTLGQSLESALLEQTHHSETISLKKGLFSLVKLQQALEGAGETELAGAVEKFLGDLRHHQLLNAKTEPGPDQLVWSEVGFRLEGERGASARLRVGREARAKSGETGHNIKRLVLQVDIRAGETVEVDLALAGKSVRTQVTAPNPHWRRRAEGELPSLEQALHRLGFQLKEASMELGDPQPFEKLKLTPSTMHLMTVNIEA